MKKIVSLAFVLMLLSTVVVIKFTSPVASYPAETKPLKEVDLPVHNINSGKNFSTIQEAINDNETVDGHTILVDAGIYYEHVTINRSLSLIGENRSTTVIDGNKTGTVVTITANNVGIDTVTIQNSGSSWDDKGICLLHSRATKISNNTISNNFWGISMLYDSNDNIIIGNTISNNTGGLDIAYSSGNVLRYNNFSFNEWNFLVEGFSFSDYIQNVDTSNLIEEKPIYYWVNQRNKTIPADVGYVGVVNSTEIVVKNVTSRGLLFAYTNNSLVENVSVSQNYEGMKIYYSEDNTARGNMVLNNYIGIKLVSSSGNTLIDNTITYGGMCVETSDNNKITNNTVSNSSKGIELRWFSKTNVIANNTLTSNQVGISMSSTDNNTIEGNRITRNECGILVGDDCSKNTFYHNNFGDNEKQVSQLSDRSNRWDNGIEGNYWSDYIGEDLDDDGIGDTFLPHQGMDYRPLMDTWPEYPPSPRYNTTIQAAINAANDGGIIEIRAGIYYEHVVVNKSLTLIGWGKEITIVDGGRNGTVVTVTADNVTISGFTMQRSNPLLDSGFGVFLLNSSNNIITENTLRENGGGIRMQHSTCNHLIKNEIVDCGKGIELNESNGNNVSGNKLSGNWHGIFLSHSCENKIFGNDISFRGLGGSGIILEHFSENNNLSNNNVKDGYMFGVVLRSSDNNSIYGNTVANNRNGIQLIYSNGTTASRNNIANNQDGLYIYKSKDNRFYHNNFRDNTQHVSIYTSDYTNFWDDGYPSGGNYWSDYDGTDLLNGPYQNISGSDGIGDTLYDIDENNQDNYPLMGMFSDFNATSEYHVQTICNSAICDFQFNGTAISFNVSGEVGTTGFCRMCIPTALMNGTYKVFVNSTEVPYTLLPCSNSTSSYLYFTYNHSTKEVTIIPEFPTWTSILLILIMLTFAIAISKRRLLKTPIC